MERDEITMIVAQNIGLLMQARNLDAAKLARLSGLNPTGIYDILSGKSRSPKIETIGKIAKALGVPIATILEENAAASIRQDLMHLFDELPEDRKELLLQTARAWMGQRQPA